MKFRKDLKRSWQSAVGSWQLAVGGQRSAVKLESGIWNLEFLNNQSKPAIGKFFRKFGFFRS
jgi:hypothetical protein